MTTNQAQRERWNADSQASAWVRRERITLAVTPHLLAALDLRAGERVLEIGSGGGLAAIEAAKRVAPSGSVTGFDISGPLVRLSAERAETAAMTNVHFVAGDAQTDDIPDAPFDVAMSQFGVMFFADPVAAFANIRRHLREGARITFACWQSAAKNAWYAGRVLAEYQPPPEKPADGSPPPGPFAFADAAYVGSILERSGFKSVAHKEMPVNVSVPEDSVLDRTTIDALKLDAEQSERAWTALQEFVATLRGDDGQLHLRLAPQFFSAQNAT